MKDMVGVARRLMEIKRGFTEADGLQYGLKCAQRYHDVPVLPFFGK